MKKANKVLASLVLSSIPFLGFGLNTSNSFADTTFIKDSYFSRLIPEEKRLREIENKPVVLPLDVRLGRNEKYACIDKVEEYQELLKGKNIPTIITRILSNSSLYRYHAVLEALVQNPETKNFKWVVLDPSFKNNLDGLPVEVAYGSMSSLPNAYFNEKNKKWVNINNVGLESLRKELANNYIRDVLYKKAQESFRETPN